MKKLYYSEHRSPGGNQNTEALARLFSAVRAMKPCVWACPARDPFPADPRIRAVRFSGLPDGNRQTEVFAYIGFPENASPASPVPGMVLTHGGGGHAYAEWVRYWTDHGFAAISFDGFGQTYTGPDRSYDADLAFWAPDPAAAPPMDGFGSKEKPLREQGFFYYAADILLANTLLRNDPRVDPAKIGLTGISWGGIAAGTALGYDDRFAFAAPVYGCGFQDVSQTVWGQCFRGEGITDVWDAKLLLGGVRIPVHWFDGDGDPFFDANSATASAAASPNGALTLLPGFTHGQTEGAAIPELLRFAEEQTGRGQRNIRITALSAENGGAALRFSLPGDVRAPAVWLRYKTQDLIYKDKYLDEAWRCMAGRMGADGAWVRIPEEARLFYFCVTGQCAGPDGAQTLHAASGVYNRGSWEAAEI